MSKASTVLRFSAYLSIAALVAGLAACGGGDDGDDSVTVKGTAARGAALPGAAIVLECGDGSNFSATTAADGSYSASANGIAYPCIGTATVGPIQYRTVVFSGIIANFTPLTDVLTAVTLGAAQVDFTSFLSKVRTDSVFSRNVVSAASTYRTTALNVVRQTLIDSGKTPEEADDILAAANNSNFESTSFTIGSPLDQVLDDTGDTLLGSDGAVKPEVREDAQDAGDDLPVPPSSGTGGTGGTGGSGS